MRKFTLFMMLMILSGINAIGQDSSELERRKGFKNIKLASPVDSIPGIKFKKDFKEKNEFDAKLYIVEHEDYKAIGEVPVERIELKTYKGLIYEITVVAAKDTRLMRALESIYGKSTFDSKNELYFWNAPSLSLSFKSHGKSQLQMVYFSSEMVKMMKADKEKKVVDIADDF